MNGTASSVVLAIKKGRSFSLPGKWTDLSAKSIGL